jgi:hypothetical protein
MRATTTTTTTPDGKEWYAEGSMRMRYLDLDEVSCPSRTSCLGVLVYSVVGCSRSGYMEFTVLDRNGFVVGRANDSFPRLQRNEIYRTVVSTYIESAHQFRLGELRC